MKNSRNDRTVLPLFTNGKNSVSLKHVKICFLKKNRENVVESGNVLLNGILDECSLDFKSHIWLKNMYLGLCS